MPTRLLAIGNTELTGITIEADSQRTVLIIQNLDTVAGTDYLYVSDSPGSVITTGMRIAPVGGSLTLRRTDGEEPEKTYRLVAATAACPVRVMELFGEALIQIEEKPDEPSPQQPFSPTDAPKMTPIKRRETGYR